MTSDLRLRAEKLAEAGYTTKIALDETTSGRPVWFVTVLELPGCMAQGETPIEALENLRQARIEYILSLLEDNLPVPAATRTAVSSTSRSGMPAGGEVDEYTPAARESERERAKVDEPAYRHDIAEVAEVA